jgi:hypothetical protein
MAALRARAARGPAAPVRAAGCLQGVDFRTASPLVDLTGRPLGVNFIIAAADSAQDPEVHPAAGGCRRHASGCLGSSAHAE